MNVFRSGIFLGAAALVGVAVALLAAAQTPAPVVSGGAAAGPVLPYRSADQTVGVVNCASGLCHGSVHPYKEINVLQTEYVTWSRVDKHARAYLILANTQSRRIAQSLGIGDPAREKICLDCHAHNAPVAQRGERFNLEDGVSCEACHGPAGRWLPVHVEDNAAHAQNLASGLYPLADPVARARLCLSCHFGNADRFVTHKLMAAGHPRMSFELDTFTAVEPAHFRPDSDWEKRKRVWDGVQVWAIGQAMVVSELMSVLADPKRSHDGLFPELVLFDCHACHHPMSEKRWAPRVPALGPGAVRLNDSSMLMARQIAKVIDPAFGARVAQAMNQLQQAAAGRGGDTATAARALKGQMDEFIGKLQAQTFAEPQLRAVLAGLIEDGLNGQYGDYAGAEQATMAIGTVANFMFQRGILKSARGVNGGLAALHAAVADDERYRPAQFQAALRDFRGTAGL
jgi:Cytochrome c554 and c-prime